MIERRLTFFVLLVFLTTLFILVLRAQGWAESCPAGEICHVHNACYDCVTGKCVQVPCSQLTTCSLLNADEKDCHIVRPFPDAVCRQKMEAAMRAMDWHVEHLVHPSLDPDFYRYKTNRESAITAYQQWNEAKRECWSTQ